MEGGQSASASVAGGVRTLFAVGTAAGLSDGELVDRFVRRGEAAEAAFAALVDRHGPMVARVCRGVLNDPHSADDAFQATFLVLALKAGAIQRQGSVASWLYGVARRVARRARADHARRAGLERRGAEIRAAGADGAGHIGDASGLVPEVQEEVDRLPEKYRAPVVLCYFEGLTHEEAAGQLRVPVGTVKVRLSRARDRLRGRLVRRGLAPGVLVVAAASGDARGAVAAPLVDATIRAATGVAAGRAAGVSDRVAALVKGVLFAMTLTRLKIAAPLAAAALTVLAASAALAVNLPKPSPPAPPQEAQAPRDEPKPVESRQPKPLPVPVEAVRKGDLTRTTSQPGTVQSYESVAVVARVAGVLKSVNADIGDSVKAGQLLAEVDAPEAALELEKAEAGVAQARARVERAVASARVAMTAIEAQRAKVEAASAELKRSEADRDYRQKVLKRHQELAARGAVSQGVLDEAEQRVHTAEAARLAAEVQLKVAKASLDELEAKLEEVKADAAGAQAEVKVAEAVANKARVMVGQTRITAPMSGVVTLRNVSRGESVGTGEARPLLRIDRTDKVRVVVHVPSRDAPLLDRGDPATVRIAALGGRAAYHGQVARTAFAEDPDKRSVRTEIDLDNPDGSLRPGQHGTVTIQLGKNRGVLTVPETAVVTRGPGIAQCYRVIDGRAVLTSFQTGGEADGRVEVIEGLNEGDLVVTKALLGLDGRLVEPKENTRPDRDRR